MGIQISNAANTPAITYNRIFLQNLKISQRSESNNNAPPHYSLTMEYLTYGIDENNNRHFQPKTRVIQIDDYLTAALAKASTEGDMDLLAAMQAIEAAVAKIIQDQTDLGTATVVA